MDPRIQANAEPIPGYRLIERLGRGGYGEVWKAEAPGGMHKAIKFVSGDVDGFGEDGKAAEQEYKSLSRIKTIRHPFLLSLERFEVIAGQLVIVMELADRNLWDRFSECLGTGLPGIPRPELLRYMDEAAEALDLMNLHHQIQHLDIKPHNIFLVHQHVKVADFGLAKDLEGARAQLTGGVTPTYAPPETFEGWVSRQSDQYSLAIVFMEMLTGRRPFGGTNTRQLVFQHLTVAPDLAALPPADREAVGRALSKAPDARFPTCAEFVRALRGEDRPAVVKPPTPAAIPTAPPGLVGTPYPKTTPVTGRQSVPALVTPSTKHSVGAGSVRVRSLSSAAIQAAAPVAPRPEETGDGVLFPALIVGIGQYGLSILRAIRQLVSDRFGSATLPHLRWLYIDTDPLGAEAATATPGTAALQSEDVLITRLQRPGHYLARDGLPPVDTWLPQEELFRMPGTRATDGVRGLGRLALCDHYHAVRHRLKTALEPFLHPTAVEAARRLTGLGLRSTFPRVYVATSATGGTGSGMFLDLTYLIRQVIRQLGFGNPHLVGLIGVPAFVPAAGELRRLSNARAALTELHHYTCSGAGFRAQFDTREGTVDDRDRPFRRCLLVPLANKLDPTAAGRAVEVTAQAAFADLLTPLGRAAHPDGGEPPAPFAIVGMRRLAWPRAAVVRAAGWVVARQTLQRWGGQGTTQPSEAVSAAEDALWNARPFAPATIRPMIATRLSKQLGGDTAELIESRLEGLAAGSRPGTADTALARAAFQRLIALLGLPGQDEREHPHLVGGVLADCVRELAAWADAKLGQMILSLVERPGLRVPGAEAVARLLRQRLVEELAHTDREAAAVESQAEAQFEILRQQLYVGGRSARRPASGYTDGLRRWAETRAAALVERAFAGIYRLILGGLPEHLRQVTTVRNQMAALISQLDADPPALPAPGGIVLPVFPRMEASAAHAASRLIDALSPDDIRELETAFVARLGREFSGLVAICSRPHEAGPPFLKALVDQATLFLDVRTPHLTATEVLALQPNGSDDGLRERVAELVATAAPAALGPGQALAAILTVVGAPADGSAARLAELAADHSPGTTVRTAATDRDIVVYQEAAISLAGLPHLTAELPEHLKDDRRGSTPHSRIDVHWVPVDSHLAASERM